MLDEATLTMQTPQKVGMGETWGYIVGGIGALVGVLGFIKTSRKDVADGAKSNATVLTELGYIKSGIDDLKRKQDAMERNFAEHGERLAKVEASAQQAHKRMDGHLRYDHHKTEGRRTDAE